jgi:hypothetical protein
LLDPPPTWALGEVLLGSQDRAFRLRIIKVLVALAAVDQIRVLCEAFMERRDVEVKRAVATALLALVTEKLGQSHSPPERPAPDPNCKEYPRVRGNSSSERVDQ